MTLNPERFVDAQIEFINSLNSELPTDLFMKLCNCMYRAVIETQIRERRDIIYVIEQSKLDNEDIFSPDYNIALDDEIAAHKEQIEQYEYDLSMLPNYNK